MRKSPAVLIVVAGLIGLSRAPSTATAQEWNIDADGKWSVPANWNPQMVPDGASATATLGAKITAARTVTLDQDTALGTLRIDNANAYTLTSDGMNRLLAIRNISVTNANGNGSHVISTPIDILGSGNISISVVDNAAAGLTLSGGLSGAGGLVKLGGGTLVLQARSTYLGTTDVQSGTLLIDHNNGLPNTDVRVATGATLDLAAGVRPTIGTLSGAGRVILKGNVTRLTTATGNASTFGGVISGPGELVKAGTGALTLTSMNTYGGSTSIFGGATIVLGINNALPPTTTLDLSGPDVPATLDLGGSANGNGFNQEVARLTGSGVVINNDGDDRTFTVANPNNDDFGGAILGNLRFVKGGANTLTLSGRTDYRGSTTVQDGTLRIGDFNALHDLSSLGLQNKGTFDLNGFSSTVHALAGTKDTSVTNSGGGSPFFRVDIAMNAASVFDGVISNHLEVVKQGDGMLTLTNNNTYLDGTLISGGILVVNNDRKGSGTGSGDVTILQGGTLRGNGKIEGKIDVRDGGNDKFTGIRPGQPGGSPGELVGAGGLTIAAGGNYAWELGANSTANPGVNFSVISLVGGTLALDPASVLSLLFTDSATAPDASDPFWQMGHTWDIIDVAAASQNAGRTNFGKLLNGDYAAGKFDTFVGQGAQDGDIILRFAPVPEPGSWLLLATGGALIALRRRGGPGHRPRCPGAEGTSGC